MAGKYALYLPYHIITALETEGFSDTEIGTFVRGIIKYHLEGAMPRFEDRALNLLFANNKDEFDYNIAKYAAVVEDRRKAGKKGGSSTSKAKAKAARENGGRGGAPRGNRNAAKKKALTQDPEPEPGDQTQPKQPLGLNEEQKTTQAVLELGLDKDNSTAAAGGGEVVFSKQPETTTTILNFLNESKKAGFPLDRKIAGKILAESPIDPAWLSGPFSFGEFAADTVKESYPNKSPAERKRLFISAFQWEDLQEEYPAWREQRGQEAEAKQRQEVAEAEERCKTESWRNSPTVCGHCGCPLDPDSRVCPSCGWIHFFDDESGAWLFHEPVNLLETFQQYSARAGP
jgi:hypothetical protein